LVPLRVPVGYPQNFGGRNRHMSGGHFEYKQYNMQYLADDIQELINKNDEVDSFGYSRSYTPETLEKMKQAIDALKRAFVMVHRIDYLVSGDDGEESFHRRWDADFEELKSCQSQ